MSDRRFLPLYDETAPIACTLAPEDVPERLATIERMRERQVRVDRTEHGLLLHFPSDDALEDDLRRFAVDEKRCCQFWGFDVRADDGLALRWDGPPSAGELVERLHTFFTGTDPVETLADLL